MNLIYDILLNPLPVDHVLRDHINFKSLERCAVEVAHSFYRSVRDFPIYREFFIKELQEPVIGSSLRIRIPDESLEKYEYDEMLWNRFHDECPIWAQELEYAFETCLDYSVGRRTVDKKQLIKQFLMDRLHTILLQIPTIHRDHTMKLGPSEGKSLGPVDLWKIIEVRQKACLAVEHYLPPNVFE